MPTAYLPRTRPTTDYDDRTDYLLQESLDFLLLEDGGYIVLRGQTTTDYIPRIKP